ncbi:MAG: PUA domain-containing protein [Nitrososphaera sp.]
MNPLPIDPREKVSRHLDALFGAGVSESLPPEIEFEYSRRTGRIKNFSVGGKLFATLRTDGGLALTLFGAQYLVEKSAKFMENCVLPKEEAVQFVKEGRSLFCKHVERCGSNVRAGSDVAIIDGDEVIAVGVSLLASEHMNRFSRGAAVKVRQGIKGRTEQLEII